jgi:branched-chain amino acid transport system substrate-binding protein
VGIGASLLGLTACGSNDEKATSTTAKAAAASQPAIKVGILQSMTGPAGAVGVSMKMGAKVVFDKANAEGGVNGRKIEMFEEDDATDPTNAARAARSLIDDKKVDVIIGSSGGQQTMAFAPIAMASKTPILAPNGTISVTAKDSGFYDIVFRTAPNDLVSSRAMYDLAVKNGGKKLGVFAQEDANGNQALDLIKAAADKDPNVDIAEVARSPLTATDLSAQATRLKNAKPDAILMQVTPAALGAAFVRALKQVGLDVPVWTSPGMAQQSFITAGGPAAEGVHTEAMTFWGEPSPGEAELATLLKAAGVTPSAFEVAGANAAQTLLEAMKKLPAGPIDKVVLRSTFETLCPFDTYAIGKDVCYSKDNHDGYGPDALVPLVVKDAKFNLFKP